MRRSLLPAFLFVLLAAPVHAGIITIGGDTPCTFDTGDGQHPCSGDDSYWFPIVVGEFEISPRSMAHFHRYHDDGGGGPLATFFDGDSLGVSIRRVDGKPFTPISVLTDFPESIDVPPTFWAEPSGTEVVLTSGAFAFVGEQWKDITQLEFGWPSSQSPDNESGVELIEFQVQVPEPGTVALLLIGMAGVAHRRLRPSLTRR